MQQHTDFYIPGQHTADESGEHPDSPKLEQDELPKWKSLPEIGWRSKTHSKNAFFLMQTDNSIVLYINIYTQIINVIKDMLVMIIISRLLFYKKIELFWSINLK